MYANLKNMNITIHLDVKFLLHAHNIINIHYKPRDIYIVFFIIFILYSFTLSKYTLNNDSQGHACIARSDGIFTMLRKWRQR